MQYSGETRLCGRAADETRTLEGNKAHGRRGRVARATERRATDPAAEQGLEVEGRRKLAAFRRGRLAKAQRQGGNGCGDTVRLRSGGLLRGVRKRCGNARELARLSDVAFGRRVVTFGWRGHLRMAVDCGRRGAETQRTLSGARLQYTRSPRCGGNRRGGEKPRGRNALCSLATARPKEAATSLGVDASGHVGGGALFKQAHERQVGRKHVGDGGLENGLGRQRALRR